MIGPRSSAVAAPLLALKAKEPRFVIIQCAQCLSGGCPLVEQCRSALRKPADGAPQARGPVTSSA